MFRALKKWIALVCILAVGIAAFQVVGDKQSGKTAEAAGVEELRGVWIASVYNIDFPSKAGLGTAQMKQELNTILYI